MARFDHSPFQTARARALRRSMTPQEVRLWQRLKGAQLGVSFRKQHPVGPYVADFAAPSIGLIVEIDGLQHGLEPNMAHDAKRDLYLRSKGMHVMRFTNEEVSGNIEGVLDTIRLGTRT